MIEFALLFGLGFLSATLLVMVLAPAVHRRVVRYTENRLKATMPISPPEVRAQRDLARAVYAAENARTKQELTFQRDHALELQLAHDKLTKEAAQLHATNDDLRMQVEDMSTEAADLRSRLRREEGFIHQLKESLQLVESSAALKEEEIEALQRRIARLATDIDTLKIDLSTRDTEVENARFRSAALREERDTLRTDVKLLTARAKEAERRLQEEMNRAARADDRLAREIAEKADLQVTVERREQQLERLQQKPKTGRSATKRNAKSGAAVAADLVEHGDGGETPDAAQIATEPKEEKMPPMPDLTRFAEDIRNRSIALGAHLTTGRKLNDDAVRQELASIAADMVALTATREGSASPIPSLLEREDRPDLDRISLAARARHAIATIGPQAPDA
ncbi:hypothetical protein [Rhizobium sp. FY34]|uniref:hypothetical protein n=1 Tax=Rhizobium sp. FY34 TaxID=2562309 RepID=UPI0010BF87E0|nr:hypothetical protein [Rhizobium sp. FY34]